MKVFSHRDLCRMTAVFFRMMPVHDLVCWELGWNGGFVDAIACSLKDRPGVKSRLTVGEVKRTRADLLADLRNMKMLKYQARSTHAYLAATKEALNWSDRETVLKDLTALGLPAGWGVIVLPTASRQFQPYVLRAARALGTFVIPYRDELVVDIAKSLSYRLLAKYGPEADK